MYIKKHDSHPHHLLSAAAFEHACGHHIPLTHSTQLQYQRQKGGAQTHTGSSSPFLVSTKKVIKKNAC